MKTTAKFSLAASAAAILTACGGGGGGGATASNTDPQGLWAGVTSTGYTVNAAVLDSGETWGIYTSGSTIYGALYGTAASNGSSISITGTNFNFLTNSSSTETLTGTVLAKSAMSLSGNGIQVPLTYQSSYDTPATAAAATGTWSFVGRSGIYSLIPGSITVDKDGRFVLNQSNCITSGSIVPRPGGKNIYNISLSAVGSACAAGNSSLAGVTYIDTTVTPNKLLALALNTNKNDGLIVIGTKQ